MKEERASYTASVVAALRTFAEVLPDREQIARDPYGAKFAGAWAESLAEISRRHPAIPQNVLLRAQRLRGFILYMQVRTRVLDDVMLEFVRGGGRQVVILGAGYDARALRFRDHLVGAGATVFEIDHPATQARKREVAGGATAAPQVRFLSWNFEERSIDQLPAALAELGHARGERTLTIWEGVTMYLTEAAIDASVAAVRAYSSPASLLAFTYFNRRTHVDRATGFNRLLQRVVARIGEPLRFGWDPAEVGEWIEERGFELVSNRSTVEYARELLPETSARLVRDPGRLIAVARRKA